MVGTADGHELNQLEWWSNWSKLVWFTKRCCALMSNDFGEPLFNHVEILSPEVDFERIFPRAEEAFRRGGMNACYFVKNSFEYRPIAESLAANGFETKDLISFMEVASPSFKASKKTEVLIVGGDGIEKWCETYLLSFYEDKSLLKPVLKATRRALGGGKTRFMLAKFENRLAGTLALYSTGRLNGAYCMGTVPKFRNKGVASTMLQSAYALSKLEGKKLVLQTFLSDSAECFYVKRGFRRAYTKEVFARAR